MSVVNNSSSCETPATSTYSGTTPFTSLVNSTIYINGYDIRITKVNNNNSGEGLLFFPYLGRRIPVEWNGNTIVKGEGEYGCITTGIVQAQGSDASILTNDLQRQIAALYNNLNEPGSYSGTFGQAIEAMKTKAQELLDKIARGETPTKEDYKGYSSICKAIDKGLKAWKTQLDEQYGGVNSDVPAIKQLYNDIAEVQADILKDVDCDGTGYHRPALRQETDLFYASIEPPKTPIHIPDLGGFLLTKCNLELGKVNALKLTKLLGDYNELKRPAPHPNLADVAAQLADNPAYIKSLELFDDNDRVWHFAQNKNLQNNISKPSYFPENANKLTDYLKNLDERKKRVLKDIAGIGADNNATLGDFDKLKQAYADWPDRYDVYYLGANGATCSFFVGECLYKSGLLTTQSKYLSALELRNSSLFAHINKQYVEKGDIVSFDGGGGVYHAEIITSVDRNNNTFCSRGAGRSISFLDRLFGGQIDGVEKCDTNVPFDNVREFDNDYKLQFLRLKR